MNLGVVFVVICVFGDVLSINILEDMDSINVRDDENLSLTCTGDSPWQYCR